MNFSFVLHNHQPVGQLPWAFEDAWRDSYAPFLEVLRDFPEVNVALHFSGPLLNWLENEKPETLTLLRDLAQSGQVEILCGGYYEPIFAIWPHEDALEQIALSQRRVQELFGVETRGLWLTERVWEPQLAEWFSAAGVEYTLLDSTLFEAAGVGEAEGCRAFTVEESSLQVFPISRTLRDLIPWHEPHETVEYLRRMQDEADADAHVLFGDDGEKFGAWPGTHEWVFEEGWLRRFFETLHNETDWLKTVTPSEYLGKKTEQRTVRLEQGSYPEMQEWSGGNWRNFLTRYAESSDMHAEVLRTRAATLHNPDAKDHILRAQSNDAYWHGVFGGLYLKHLRQAIYAECAETRVLASVAKMQGETEEGSAFVGNKQLQLGARAEGGHLFLLSSSPVRHNLLATLRRHREPYHEEGTPADWYPRGALLDHFLGDDVTPENFQSASFREEGDFISEPWHLEQQVTSKAGVLTMRREGGVWHGGKFSPLIVEKKITLPADAGELNVEYSFSNPGDTELNLWWAMEWNTVLSGNDLPERHYHADNHEQKLSLEELSDFPQVTNPIIADNWLGLWLEWQFPEPVALWHVPIFTTSEKEGGATEAIYQQSAFVFHRRLQLPPRGNYSTAFTATVTTRSAP